MTAPSAHSYGCLRTCRETGDPEAQGPRTPAGCVRAASRRGDKAGEQRPRQRKGCSSRLALDPGKPAHQKPPSSDSPDDGETDYRSRWRSEPETKSRV